MKKKTTIVDSSDVLALLGALVLLGGLAAISWPLAVAMLGLFILGIGLLGSMGKKGDGN